MKMNSGELIVNRMLLVDKQQSTNEMKVLVRVIWIDNFDSSVWLCRIDDDSWPFRLTRAELDSAMDPEHGRYAIELDDPWMMRGAKSQKDKAIKLHRQRYEMIEPLINGDNERLILYKDHRKKLIRDRLKDVKCSHDTMTKLIRIYWKRGMNFDALRPDFDKCGTLTIKGGTRKISENKKLGARRKFTPGTGINIIGEYVLKALKSGASYWMSRKAITLKDAHDRLTRVYFSKPIKDDNNRIIKYEVEPDKKPSLRQLQYYIHKFHPYGKIRRRKHGQKNWNLFERELLGSADKDAQGPGDRYQIDATIADAYVVSQFDRRRIVGRPVIYFVVDVFSRMIVGIYVGFEGPSWPGAMMALTNMVMPKVEFCRQYEIDIEEWEWPSHHAPRKILGDRGELMSVDLGRNIVEKLKIEIENASPGRPDLKAFVERRFGIVPSKFHPFTPGYVEKDSGQRGSKDPRLTATFNLYEFTQMVILAVLEHNAEPIKGVKLPAEMITEGLTGCPLDLWEWGISNRSGSLKLLGIDEVRLNVMPSDTAKVTGKGFYFQGAYYSSPTAIRKEWFAKARKESWMVNVSYDPRNLAIVYLRDESLEKGYEPCKLLDHYADHDGKSLAEIKELGDDAKLITAKGENERQEKRMLKDKQMSEIESKAKKAKKAVADVHASKSSQLAHMSTNKAEEKDYQRSLESFDMTSPAQKPEAVNTALDSQNVVDVNDYRNRELAKLAAKRKLREGK